MRCGRVGLAVSLAVGLGLALGVASCRAPGRGAESALGGGGAGAEPVDLVVVAPHPDDETLIAAGVLARAVREGRRVAVVVVTNGDYTCERDGYARQAETVRALAILGVAESAVTFLGYPDGHLAELGARPLAPVERRDAHGGCARGAVTYGARGRGHADEHTTRTGAPAEYTADALRGDLAAVLARHAPRDVYVTHGIDDHPDHAATYAYVRRALETLPTEPPALHRAVVHAGPCWPNGRAPHEPCPVDLFAPAAPLPPLPAPLEAYVPRERVAVPPEMLRADARENTKLLAIAAYASQSGPDPVHDWLASFARAEEAFFPETLVRDAAVSGQLARAPLAGRTDVLVGAARAGAYALRLEDDGVHAQLLRDADAAGREPLLLRRFRLPEPGDGAPAPPHAYTLRVEPRPDDGPVVEVTLRRDGLFLGLVVDAVTPVAP